MGENVIIVDLNEALCGLGGLVIASMVEKRHAKPVEGILILGIDLEGFPIKLDRLIQPAFAESIDGLFEKLFLCHAESITVRILPFMAKITTSAISFAAGSGQATGFLAIPEGPDPHPGLIVIQEFWGLNDHIKDVTQRLAAEGFVALAPDLYDGKVTTDATEARQLLMSLDQSTALEKLNGAVEYLKAHPQVAESRIGVIGFCMGGFHALNVACHNRDVRVVTPFYGRIPPDSVLESLNAPVLYFFGEKDHHLPAADVDRLEQFIRRTGRSGGVVRYPEADHAFFNDTRKEVYRPADAADAWTRALAFIRRHLEG